MDNLVLLPGFSFFIGILVGLTGIGGASLITPMLIFSFHVSPTIAVSSDIVAATFMKFVGGAHHWRHNTLDRSIVQWLALGSVPGSLAGVTLLWVLRQAGSDHLDSLLLRLIGGMIIVVVSCALVKMLLAHVTITPSLQWLQFPKLDLATPHGRTQTLALGAMLGSLVGMTSVSSGSLFAIALITCFQLEPRKLVGTDLAQAAILLFCTSLGHIALGTVDWGIVGLVCLGTIPGVLLGTHFCQKVPQQSLRLLLYMILVGVSWKLLSQA